MILLKAQHALKERVAINDTKKTKKKNDGRGVKSTQQERLAVESDSDTTAESEAHEDKFARKKKKGDRGKSLQPNTPKEEKNRKANVRAQPQA